MTKKKTIEIILSVFLLCSIVKNFEFLVIKTDQTFWAENILCKLFMLAVTAVLLLLYGKRPGDIGFKRSNFIKSAALGLALGISTFAISYIAEYTVLRIMGKTPELHFFITNFALTDRNITGVSWTAVVICILGNIVNVCAEEGLFRGFFLSFGQISLTERRSNLLQALLFGVWHIVTVAGWVMDGQLSLSAAAVMAAGYVLLAGILGYEWGLCAAMTGTLWAGMFEHFFNNFVTNSVHMVTETGTDEMQILRIVLSNVLSLLFVLLIMRKKARRLSAWQ